MKKKKVPHIERLVSQILQNSASTSSFIDNHHVPRPNRQQLFLPLLQPLKYQIAGHQYYNDSYADFLSGHACKPSRLCKHDALNSQHWSSQQPPQLIGFYTGINSLGRFNVSSQPFPLQHNATLQVKPWAVQATTHAPHTYSRAILSTSDPATVRNGRILRYPPAGDSAIVAAGTHRKRARSSIEHFLYTVDCELVFEFDLISNEI